MENELKAKGETLDLPTHGPDIHSRALQRQEKYTAKLKKYTHSVDIIQDLIKPAKPTEEAGETEKTDEEIELAEIKSRAADRKKEIAAKKKELKPEEILQRKTKKNKKTERQETPEEKHPVGARQMAPKRPAATFKEWWAGPASRKIKDTDRMYETEHKAATGASPMAAKTSKPEKPSTATPTATPKKPKSEKQGVDDSDDE